MTEKRPSQQSESGRVQTPDEEGQRLADHYRDAMNAPMTEEAQRQAIRLLDTIAAGEGDVPPMRGLGVPHVSDLTDEEAEDV